jgi:hypothetical protein
MPLQRDHKAPLEQMFLVVGLVKQTQHKDALRMVFLDREIAPLPHGQWTHPKFKE